jgi:Gluconate 2-dehydrogenase subunit 3
MLQSVLGVSAASTLPSALFSQEKKPDSAPPIDENPKLDLTMPDAVAGGVPRFFDSAGLAALRRLGEILVPAQQNAPGAKEADAAEFLDFLIFESPSDRQKLYRDGVAQLIREAKSRYGKLFDAVSATEADAILAPLREPWTYGTPSDPFARFLLAAKDDFLTATVNSRQWAMASAAGRRRSGAGLNTYWFPIE